jgi:hypothetical protein
VLGVMKNKNNISQLNDNIDTEALNEFGSDNNHNLSNLKSNEFSSNPAQNNTGKNNNG